MKRTFLGAMRCFQRERMKYLYLFFLLCLMSSSVLAMEITPLFGHRGGGDFSHIATDKSLSLNDSSAAGFILGAKQSATQDLELYYSGYSTKLASSSPLIDESEMFDMDVHYLHLGGTVTSGETSDLIPFLSGGLGVTYFSPDLSGADSELRLSMSLGGGVKWFPMDNIGLRLEARGFGTLFNNATYVFCSGGCVVEVSGDVLYQYELFAGIVVRLD